MEDRIQPYINADGWYAQCPNCLTEIEPYQDCPKCKQLIDWDWFKEPLSRQQRIKNSF